MSIKNKSIRIRDENYLVVVVVGGGGLGGLGKLLPLPFPLFSPVVLEPLGGLGLLLAIFIIENCPLLIRKLQDFRINPIKYSLLNRTKVFMLRK
jgi:hypothetical protein